MLTKTRSLHKGEEWQGVALIAVVLWLAGDGEKARLEASGLAGFLNDSIITMGLERLCEQDNINVRAVPTNPQTFT